MLVSVITSIRKGGPFYWGAELSRRLNKTDSFVAHHVHSISGMLIDSYNPKVDIIHTTIPFPPIISKKPVVLTVKGDYTIEKNISQPFYPAALKKAEIVTVPSQYLKEKLGVERALVIPNAVNLEKFSFVARTETVKDSFKVLTVTKFWFPDKARGVVKSATVLARVQEGVGVKIVYHVLGDGTYLQEVKEQVKDLPIEIRFHGFGDPLPYYKTANLFLYFSEHDNMPNVILEAMASGLPIISNSVGAMAEMIESGETGFIIDDLDSWEPIIRSMIKDQRLRKEMGLKARKRIEDKFDWETILPTYLSLYKQLCSK